LIASMTGFGEAVFEDQQLRVGFRIRGVNHKGLDTNFKIPFEIAHLEPQFRNRIKKLIFRGRMDIFSEFKLKEKSSAKGLFLDRVRLQEVLDTAQALGEFPEVTGKMDVNTLIRMPDLTVSVKMGQELPTQLEEIIKNTLDEALKNFLESRIKEGRTLYDDFLERLGTVTQVIDKLETMVIARREHLVEIVRKRVSALLEDVTLDENRLYQEVVFQADRLDVTEELTRLKAHVADLEEKLRDGHRPLGKRLEFLLQEAMREVSTIGNKARSLDVAPLVVTLKTELEKVREQVLNIE